VENINKGFMIICESRLKQVKTDGLIIQFCRTIEACMIYILS